jgi:hypothetical protein
VRDRDLVSVRRERPWGGVTPMKLPKTTRSILFAVILAYVANALLIVLTEQLLARAFSDAKYFVADVVAQSVIQVGCGYLCSLISNARSGPAIVGLIAIGLLVGGFSLAASWHADPHWYGIALILVYGPCVWIGYRIESGRAVHAKTRSRADDGVES